MSQYLLDTNICVFLMRGDTHLQQMVAEVGPTNCFLSEVTVAELLYGLANCPPAYRATEQARMDKLLRPFQPRRTLSISPALQQYADVKAHLRRIGRLQGEFDILIGSTALTYGLVLVTRNGRHFADLPLLTIMDWLEKPGAEVAV